MKRGISPGLMGGECYNFGTDNKLRIFPPNSFKFKPRDHIVLDNVQECILDNFWYQYNNKREDKGYMLAILNSLAEYLDIDQALSFAKSLLGINYFIEPAAKEYIQKYKRTNDMKINKPVINIQEAGPSKVPTYKDVAKKEILNEDIIEKKIKERLNSIIPQLKKNIKDEILKEVDERFQIINHDYEDNIKKDYDEYIKKDYDLKMNIQTSDYDNNDDNINDMLDENMMDIRGHGQPPEY